MTRFCPDCKTIVEDGFRFCNICGAAIKEDDGEQIMEANYYNGCQRPDFHAIRIVLGTEHPYGSHIQFTGGSHTIGTSDAEFCFKNDIFLSQLHACLSIENNKLFIEDAQSTNGVFLRIKDSAQVKNGCIIRAGEHFFLLDCFENIIEPGDGPKFFATPDDGETFRLVEILNGGYRGRAVSSPTNTVTVGRSDDVDFRIQDDPYISPRHFSIRVVSNNGGILIDHFSRNGTYVQIKEKTQLEYGDMLFIGQQLFRVEV